MADLDAWLAPVADGTQALLRVKRTGTGEVALSLADASAWNEVLTATVGVPPPSWSERRLLVRLLAHAQAAEGTLGAPLARAQGRPSALLHAPYAPARARSPRHGGG